MLNWWSKSWTRKDDFCIITPWKTNHESRCISLNMAIFHCHLSFWGGYFTKVVSIFLFQLEERISEVSVLRPSVFGTWWTSWSPMLVFFSRSSLQNHGKNHTFWACPSKKKHFFCVTDSSEKLSFPCRIHKNTWQLLDITNHADVLRLISK